ncbi:hypothetical protein KAR91_42935 [Candidatus Pacearchaeota archaeon]|nr:hypothetical protein [Candidatus Pacearchaeota archaeon]
MKKAKCIYCLKLKPIQEFSHREHVLPESFGAFENNFVLTETVCNKCNKFFGDNLELNLGRDSIEGILRFQYETKLAEEFKSLGKRSSTYMRVPDGPFEGAFVYFEYSDDANDIVIRPLPQIGFLEHKSKKPTWYLIHEIPKKDELLNKDVDFKKKDSIQILACDPDRAVFLLKEKGIEINNFKKKGQFNLERTSAGYPLRISSVLDDIKLRAIAKIAFNYLAYWEKSSFVLDRNFDVIRKFILKGERPTYEIIYANSASILIDERFSEKRRIGHIITVNWASDNVSIIGQVSLFNFIKYQICLSREFSGEKRKIGRGHLFNLRDRKILEMGNTSNHSKPINC